LHGVLILERFGLNMILVWCVSFSLLFHLCLGCLEEDGGNAYTCVEICNSKFLIFFVRIIIMKIYWLFCL